MQESLPRNGDPFEAGTIRPVSVAVRAPSEAHPRRESECHLPEPTPDTVDEVANSPRADEWWILCVRPRGLSARLDFDLFETAVSLLVQHRTRNG